MVNSLQNNAPIIICSKNFMKRSLEVTGAFSFRSTAMLGILNDIWDVKNAWDEMGYFFLGSLEQETLS